VYSQKGLHVLECQFIDIMIMIIDMVKGCINHLISNDNCVAPAV